MAVASDQVFRLAGEKTAEGNRMTIMVPAPRADIFHVANDSLHDVGWCVGWRWINFVDGGWSPLAENESDSCQGLAPWCVDTVKCVFSGAAIEI